MENYIPKIRFKGAYNENGKWVEFTHPWEQRKLGDIITEYKETVDSDCTLPILTSSKTEGVILQEEHFGRKQQHDITGYNILPRNYCTYRNRSDGVDFTFNINKCCDKGIISKFYPVFSGKNSDVFFLSLVLNNSDEVVREIAYTCTGTGQKVLSFLDLQKMNVRVPNFAEQKEIAAYFERLDYLITLHQRKCDLYQQAKQSMMEKLFSNNVDWEEKQLGKILIRNPKSNIGVHETQQMKSGDIPYFTSGEKIFYINDFLVKGENIFVNDGGVADIKYYNGKANYSDHILSLKNIDNSICLQFVYQSLLSKIKIINDKLFHGLGLKNLSKKDFMNFTISIPDIEEQIKIANILSKYDELIAISKNQLNTLQTLKKGLLQQMFV